MFDSNLVTSLASVIHKARTASEIAPILEDLRHKLPAGYGVARPADGVHRPVEAVLVAQEDRGITPEVTTALTALRYARHNLEAAIEAMNAAVDRWQAPQK
ncbi:hypothetical protein SAMN02982929_07180 [Saccharopolyspora kobensis]|uniref:Uncharacterized protein n=1 Tax=Saccharopolyspora kobensis TaxID=146035 RepID=A0A1H6EPQ3_9PSEU|nr:hypothetical protein [Saccharopolyspora kobensis]SEG98674.1 hypothetical protein SAMN02982929_07180 [Saccharopolyspora kobensis]SFD23948.1 hypothetical protein SAMN05216506_103189 [Saccharopolyspora kobensis]